MSKEVDKKYANKELAKLITDRLVDEDLISKEISYKLLTKLEGEKITEQDWRSYLVPVTLKEDQLEIKIASD